jgi:urea transport system permease protein
MLLLALTGAISLHSQNAAPLAAALDQLREASFAEKEEIVARIGQTGHPSIYAVLMAFLEDRLVYRNDDNRIAIVKAEASAQGANESPRTLLDPLTLKTTGSAPADSFSAIGTNNRLRKLLRISAARFAIASSDSSIRLQAVRNLMNALDDEQVVALLRERSGSENDAAVKAEIATGLALVALGEQNREARLRAIETLRTSVSQDVRNRLAALTEKPGGGDYAESDPQVREAAAAAVATIDYWRSFYGAIETLFFGVSLGSVLVLVAIGLAITFGVVGVINMAHGELMMLGAYTTYVVQTALPQHIGISILVAVPAAFLVAGAAGVLMERTIIRFLYGRPLETLLATFGVSLILQQSVRSVFSALNRSVVTPEWMSGSLRINDALAITYNRLYIIAFSLMVFALVLLVIKRTRLGLNIRAVSQNRSMAKAMGIRTEWVDAMTFGLGSGIAGVAGVALSQLTNVGPNLGQAYIIDSFMVVVFGGVGNLWGSLIGGMSMGIANNLLEPWAGAVLAKILLLLALILFIQARPRGLFPQSGRAAEDK